MKPLANTNQHTITEAWNSSTWTQLRSSMVNGADTIPECWSCSYQEEKFGTSTRTQALQDYKFFSEKHYDQVMDHHKVRNLPFPNRVEVHVGNLCNLKCMTCRPEDSSALLTENKILKIDNLNQQDYAISDSILKEIQTAIHQGQVKILDLRGGETLIMPQILKFLKNLDPSCYQDVQLRIQTNCTELSDEWKHLIKKFKQVEIMASIDSIGEYNTYIRYPSSWDPIEENINWFKTQDNIKLYVNCTVSNLNILSLPKLINWCNEQDIFCHFQTLMWPYIFKYNNLPKSILTIAQNQLKPYQNIAPNISAIVESDCLNDETLWQEFCKMVDLRDQHRKNRIFNLHPELKEHWHKQVD